MAENNNYINFDGSYPLVKENDTGIRPAGKPDECFYCGSKVGEPHKHGCVTVVKKVKLKATIEYEKEVPADWDDEQIYYHYNLGTWCANNIVDDLKDYIDELNEYNDCLCHHSEIEVIEEQKMNDIKIEKIDVNCPARPLSEDFQEYFDKLYGRPCTDMYDFEYLTLEECEEKGLDWGWKSKKKENITEDQKIKKQREKYSYLDMKPLIVTEEMTNISTGITEQVTNELKKVIDEAILERLFENEY